jgi:hypothetical protein
MRLLEIDLYGARDSHSARGESSGRSGLTAFALPRLSSGASVVYTLLRSQAGMFLPLRGFSCCIRLVGCRFRPIQHGVPLLLPLPCLIPELDFSRRQQKWLV